MKTRFSRRTDRLSPARKIALIAAGVVILILGLLRLFFPGALIALTAPLHGAGEYLTLHLFPGNAVTLARENAALKEENAALLAKNADLAAARADIGEEAESGIYAGVLARPPGSPYDSLIIGKGNDAGVFVGMRVLAGGVPVGTIVSASGGSARVALYSAPGTDTDGWAGAARVPVTLHGEGGGGFSADVPKDAKIAEGDLVYLPGPGALAAGTIVAIESQPSSARATLRIRPAANPFTMTTVRVVASPAP